MPDRDGPTSENEQQFARLVDRIFADEEFARAMDSDPEATLREAGVELGEPQLAGIRQVRRFEVPDDLGDGQNAISWTRPVVQILTKGTRPVVNVVVNSVVVEESDDPVTRPVDDE
jgi:hypothetical protein